MSISSKTRRQPGRGKTPSLRNADIAEALRRYAAILAIQRENRFKVRAYERAAATIEWHQAPIADMIARGDSLEGLPGIGKAIGGMVRQMVETGKLAPLEASLAELPSEIVELSTRPSLNFKTALRAYKKLKLKTLDELSTSLETGTIEKSLGRRAAFQIQRGLDSRPRMLWWKARHLVERLAQQLSSMDGVEHIEPAGSFRRKQDTIGDLAFVITSKSPARILQSFANHGGVQSWESLGRTAARFHLPQGVTLNLYCARPALRAVTLLQATGSHAHWQAIHQLAKQKGVSLSPGRRLAKPSVQEVDIYNALGLDVIEPELREARGEIEAARSRSLPSLISIEDIRGDLHMHTTTSDGVHSLEEMAEAAQGRGYQYIAISEHSQSLKIARGVSIAELRRQMERIDRLNAKLKDFVILKSAEVDILEDGSLDYPNSVLRELDFAICSIHSRFQLNKSQQTARILRAIDNPYCSMIGHMTGRLLLRREGYEVDFDRILKHAKETGCAFEINANPNRLDLSDEHARQAMQMGIPIAVNTDAHSISELDFMVAGINQARRAWLAPSDVLNTLSLPDLKNRLRH